MENKEIFINNFISKWGNIVDFSNFIYINNKTKTCFKCLKHGDIKTSPANSIIYGLKCCNDEIRNNIQKEKVIGMINDKYNGFYDLSKIEEFHTRSKIVVICPVHGEFKSNISNFAYTGISCKKCADDKKKLSKKQIIEKINIKYNNFFEYINIDSIEDTKSILEIKCPTHNIFKQSVKNHLRSGCKKCHFDKIKLNYNEFLNKCNNIFKNKYSYYESTYKGTSNKLKINCPIHGDFWQNAKSHLNGSGCYKCSNFDIDSAINELKNININYDYSHTKNDFKTIKNKVRIICNKHGFFKQSIYSHFHCKQGCPKCRFSKGEKIISEFLISNNISFESQYKFDECKNIRKLPFDFYLYDNKICIEYDGIQHYKPIDVFGGEVEFQKTIFRDSIKNKFCEDNNILLFRISYDDDILNKLLFLVNEYIIF